MASQIPVGREAVARDTERGSVHELCANLSYQRLGIVNVVFFGRPGAPDREWVLIDAGVMGTAALIRKGAGQLFGHDSRPSAILLTHGHFDHVGALKQLAEEWDVPVYAHTLELPYLDGRSSYPPPDPTVGGGLMSALAPLYPRGPIDVRPRLHPLADDGCVPGMPAWRWIATPGHAPRHVSFWSAAERRAHRG